MDPLTNVEFFTGAKDFNIRNGRFRTIAGDSYTNCYPPPVSPVRQRPPINTMKTSFFTNSSNFEIGGGEFLAINGDSVDFSPPFGVPGPRLDDGYYDPGFSRGSAPQSIGRQFSLDVQEDWPSHEQPEDVEQATNVPNYTRDSAEEGQKRDNMTRPGVHVARAANHLGKSSSSPPRTIHPENTVQWNTSQGKTFQAIPPANVVTEPPHFTSRISYRTTPTQLDTSRTVPVGDESTPVANMQGGRTVMQPAKPCSLSETGDQPNPSPQIASAHMYSNGNETRSPPSKSKRLLNWIKNLITRL